jgi:glycosyltransferase involved in cell wall biosynthesis
MNILLTLHYPLNINAGAAGVTLKIGEEYKKLGHTISYYSSNNIPKCIPGTIGNIIFPFFVAFKIWQMIEFDNLDIVYSSSGDTWFWCKFLKRFTRKKWPLLAVQSHGLEHTLHEQILEDSKNGLLKLSWKYNLYRGNIFLWNIAASFKGADICFLLNKHEAVFLEEKMGVDKKKIVVLSNGIPEELIGCPFQEVNNNSAQMPGIALIGSYIERKGIRYSVPALESILSKNSNIEVRFLGTGCSKEIVLSDFSEAVRSQVKIIPSYNREDLPSLVKSCHILLFPSLYEGFPLAVIEAMACGLAPIVTEIPGPTEIVVHGINGLIVKPRDTNEIAIAIEALLQDHLSLNKLKKEAYQAVQCLSWKTIADQHMNQYNKADKYRFLNN